jgi:XTP/dITP diphosphohydrolase
VTGTGIVLASANRHKQREIAAILEPVRVALPEDLGVAFEYEETGTTFLDNALGKARHLHSAVGIPVLADDSGLVVPALGGAPGVYSARYGDDLPEAPGNDRERYELLLARMSGIADRRAWFVCCLVLVESEDRFTVVQETFEGEILHSPEGSGGFGYDPVFYVRSEGMSAAELSPQRKNEISHRGKALARLANLFDDGSGKRRQSKP